MNKIVGIGVGVFLLGVLIIGAYSLYPLFYSDIDESTVLFGIKLSLILMGIGAAIILITMSIERYKDWKKMKEEIGEKELRP